MSQIGHASVQHAAILAGGASRRMGENKALLEVDGTPLVARVARVLRPLFANVIVITSDPATARAADVPAVPDAVEGRGPLGGLHAALSHFAAPAFCVACDMPLLRADFIAWQCAQLGVYQAVVPHLAERWEPLHAVYAPGCLPIFAHALEQEKPPALQRVLRDLNVRRIAEAEARAFDPSLQMFANWNTPEDVAASR